jgi:hypothetical protein
MMFCYETSSQWPISAKPSHFFGWMLTKDSKHPTNSWQKLMLFAAMTPQQ